MADEDEVPVAGSKKWLLIGVIAVVVLALAGGGAWFFLLGGTDDVVVDEGAAETVVAREPVQYLELSPAFIVNFPHQGRQRFMQATVTLMSRDAEALEAVQRHMPAIRHNLINLLSAQLILVFEDPAGIEDLRQMATDEVNQVLQREIGHDGIEQLLFTNFVMQ
ncbi:flagellar basal body-associated FliL family protein [Pseudohongiella sp.]|uniref:Flagellar basal body-associated protein FliL n=1 Tax=marine sediment metagenome TaxID=412755 RepID=A0A0F9WE51_9ZZZZ|nr:flagellar basal body-associated FliL family protein [Pseudohongiella sp.]